MEGVQYFFICCLLLFSESFADDELNTRRFPENFKFGVATASYQVEGGWNASDKSPNIWDYALHKNPDLVVNRDNGDVACDSYHKYKEDVALLKDLGVDFYRFSLSWSRILPNGIDDKISVDGVNYYKNLIAELRNNNIEPLITIYHWDLPQILQDAGGWTNDNIVDWFVAYANVCFKEFGNDNKNWLVFNEPKQTCQMGYGTAEHAPFINSSGVGEYVCAHNLLKAYAKTWHLYNAVYRNVQGGRVGITIDSSWFEPATESREDIEAAERGLHFTFGLYANPILNRDYPAVMKSLIAKRSSEEGLVKSRLPAFTEEEIEYISGSYDFLGVNTYTSNMAKAENNPDPSPGSHQDAEIATWQPDEWERTNSSWLKVTPWGARKLLNWIKNTYGNPEIIITENGLSDDDSTLEDDNRIRFYQSYLSNIHDAMELDGVNVTGYTAWSFMDNFEWTKGYSERFGIYHVDFSSPNRTRIKKKSATWYQNLIKTKCIVDECID
nr:myrosinase 1-like [Leptinotarsa decemlineata]